MTLKVQYTKLKLCQQVNTVYQKLFNVIDADCDYLLVGTYKTTS